MKLLGNDPVDRNIRLLLLMTMMQNTLFILPVIVPYYRDEMGIGFREFMIAEAFFAATVILMEVPTGWLSDVWHRKRTMMLSFVIYILGCAVLLNTQGLAGAIAAQMTIGVAISLLSGTNSAFLYDTLLAAGRQDEFRRLEGLRHGTGFYTLGLAAIAGGSLYAADHRLPIALMLVAQIFALVTVSLMTEPARETHAPERHPLRDMLGTVHYALRGHREVGAIIVFAGITFCATKIVMWSQQPYYMMMKVPEIWFGLLSAIGFLLAGLGGHLGHHIDGRLSNMGVMHVMLGAICAICFITALVPSHATMMLLMAGSIMFGIAFPRVQNELNARVDSTRRATILSTMSLMVSLLFIPLGSLAGIVAGAWDIRAALFALGVFTVLAGGGALAMAWRRRQSA